MHFIAALVVVDASATEAKISDVAVHLEAVRMRLESGHVTAARDALAVLNQRHKPDQLGIVDALELGLLLSDVGLDTASSTYFRHVAAQAGNEDKLDALERSAVAAAVYAIGRPEAAAAILGRCRERWPDRQFRCRPWGIAQVAASKDDWDETARVLDAELVPGGKFTVRSGQTAPVRVLKLRLKAAWHRGDKLEIGRWRAILIRRGVRPDHTPAPQPVAVGTTAQEPRKSGLMWIVMSLSLVLLSALLLARRSAAEE